MFLSRRRPIIIPQHEHARLAGALAGLWSNSDFARPAIPFESFVSGVTLHDRGYGPHDTLPVDTSDEREWIAVQERGLAARFTDPVAEAVVLLHLRRLASFQQTAARAELGGHIEEALDEIFHSARLDKRAMLSADLITKLCDDIAFDFCWEREMSRESAVHSSPERDETVKLRYDIHPTERGGKITVKPWPFSVSAYSGFILGYDRESYPTKPIPVWFEVSPT